MAESPPRERPISLDKENLPIAPANSDVELGDPGDLVHAAPLARKLKGRHMQMIAIGNNSYIFFMDIELTFPSSRWRNWCRLVCWLWQRIGNRRTGKFGMCNALLYLLETAYHHIP
jgi:hypothetical protein